MVANLYDSNYDLDLRDEQDHEEQDASCITVSELCPEHHRPRGEEDVATSNPDPSPNHPEPKQISSLKDLCMDKISAQLPFIADDALAALPIDLLSEFTQRFLRQRLCGYDDPDLPPTLRQKGRWLFMPQKTPPELSLFSVSNGNGNFALGVPEFNVVRVWECQPVLRYRASLTLQQTKLRGDNSGGWTVEFVAISPKGGRVAVGLRQQPDGDSFKVEIWGASGADTFECWGIVDMPRFTHDGYGSQPDIHRYHPVRWAGEDTLFYFYQIQYGERFDNDEVPAIFIFFLNPFLVGASCTAAVLLECWTNRSFSGGQLARLCGAKGVRFSTTRRTSVVCSLALSATMGPIACTR